MKKKTKIVLSVFACMFAVAVIGLIAYEYTKPLDPYVTISGVQSRVQDPDSVTIFTRADGAFYDIESSSEFADLFSFDEWEQKSHISGPAELLFSMQLGEMWIVDIYSNGEAEVYNGYSGLGTKYHAYYKVPENTASLAAAYIEENGTPVTLLYDSIGDSILYHGVKYQRTA